ncbi:unnamed protein product [Clonostachys solani]|uniref:Histone H1 n=1 Tax=Clonostachys solani TaxID=160281 RepID=A0A9N9VX53_9HYPO|nr:unnamed protein product [Clonostachys solani]
MAPAASATKKAAAAPKAKASHASYQDMIIDAIVNLKDRNGSSRQSLKKYVKANNQLNLVSDKMFDSLFNKALKNGVDKDIFEQPKGPSGGTKLAKKKVEPKKEKKAAPAPKKETVVKKTATKATTEKKAAAPKKAAAAPKATKAATEKKAAAPKKAAPKKAAAKAEKPETTLTKTKSGRVTKTQKPAATTKKTTATTKKAAPKKAAAKA